MLTVLCSGTLARDPQARTGAAGKPFATALMRTPCEDAEAILVSVIAFDPQAVRALLALSKGDAVAVAGRAKLSTWQKDGETRHGLAVVGDQVLSVYALNQRRKAARPEALDDAERFEAARDHP